MTKKHKKEFTDEEEIEHPLEKNCIFQDSNS